MEHGTNIPKRTNFFTQRY